MSFGDSDDDEFDKRSGSRDKFQRERMDYGDKGRGGYGCAFVLCSYLRGPVGG